ncbi:MAG: amidohydrolase [Firmicutes bacterium]|nr:amidohydrolase [Bacillota bacterium]
MSFWENPAGSAAGDHPSIAIVHGRVYTGTGVVFDPGTVIIAGGKIQAVGGDADLAGAVPANARIVDARGKVVTPGLIDPHTHLGISEEGIGWEGWDYNETTDPVTPQLRAIDGINPEDEGLKDAARNGITTVITGPGSANVIGGQSVAIKTWGHVIDDMVVRQPAGMKAAFGENPKRVYSQQKKTPVTRMGTAALMRKALVEAQNYRDKWERWEAGGKDPEKKPERNLAMEALLPVLRRELPMRVHSHRADDIMTAIRIAEEFDIVITIEHATEAHKVAPELAKRHLRAVVGPNMTSRSKVELRDKSFATPRVLYEAGVEFALCTDHPVIPIQFLPLCAAMAVRAGLPEDVALRAMTLNAADIIGVADRLGSLEPGKDADVVVWSGWPLEAQSQAEAVFINGQQVPRE